MKREEGLPIEDLETEKKVLENGLTHSEDLGLDKDFTKKIINTLISESLKIQGLESQGRSKHLYGVFEKANELISKGKKLIRLEIGEPNFLCHPSVKEAAIEALKTNKKIGYVSSAGIIELRENIAEKVNESYGTSVSPNQILMTPGGKFGVFSGILTSISEADRILLVEPYWPVYEECAIFARARIDRIHTVLDEEWRIDLEEVEEAFETGTKLMVLCNPSNPTGKITAADELEAIVELANEKNVTILADEVYDAYTFKPFRSILETECNNFIYIQSFSKRYGMTGWRVGYAVSDVNTVKRMQKVMQISATCIPEFVQIAAIKALEIEDEILKKYSEAMRNRVEIASRGLKSPSVSFKKPDGGMYVFPRGNVEGFDSREFAMKLLSEEKVTISPGLAFGEYPEHFRISLGGNEEDIREGIKRIVKMIEKWKIE